MVKLGKSLWLRKVRMKADVITFIEDFAILVLRRVSFDIQAIKCDKHVEREPVTYSCINTHATLEP